MLFSLKKKEILQYGTTWMNLKDVTLNEISQSQKDGCHMISPIGGSKVVKLIESKSRI